MWADLASEILASLPPEAVALVQGAWLVGSRARGDAHELSDLDIAVAVGSDCEEEFLRRAAALPSSMRCRAVRLDDYRNRAPQAHQQADLILISGAEAKLFPERIPLL